jgi:stearoyl-CoA desaturase (delta-9 desaturase)
MYDVTLKNRVKGINWHTAVFIALFHVGAVAAFFVFNWKAALEGGPIYWVVTHRIHHPHADGPGDPHTPRDGAWWSHMG